MTALMKNMLVTGNRFEWDAPPMAELVDPGKGSIQRFRAEAGGPEITVGDDGEEVVNWNRKAEWIEVVRGPDFSLKFETSSPLVRYVYRWRDRDGNAKWIGDLSLLDVHELRSGYFASVTGHVAAWPR